MPSADDRVPVLYLAPWLEVGGSDKGTLDWFRFLDRDRFRPSLITTQPSPNPWLARAAPYAEEVWDLPDLMPGNEFARFILTFIHTRGVRILHIMNSRLGFELLPDVAHLPVRPRVVIQLHVEELDRSGYVRYVTTRYGNLVDAFSVSSQALSDALEPYEVPVPKRRLIRTGVDAEREFSPARVTPLDGLDPNLLQILAPVRLTAQKDPLLMVEVAARLRDRGVRFRLHLLGDGELESDVRDRISALGLDDAVTLPGARLDIAPWYAACDVVLLTSTFEGVPYAIYEAMAMATPFVAPHLPGVAELATPETGVLVNPREDPDGYAAALAELAADPLRRNALGSAGRALVLSELPLERMAAEHASLYEELLATPQYSAPGPEDQAQPPKRRQPLTPGLRSRRPGATPLVSVIVPCYNHGRYVRACIESIAGQTYAPIETIVVDDGSTDPETLEALTEIEGDGVATIVRMAANRGPSAARNAAIERARGRYLLPVDADNVLLPGAVAALVEQLSSAGERIGFVFPNYQFFGNRTEYFEPPSYNLNALLTANYCDTSSLIDREVFARGFRYPEDILLGIEDWDLVLSLAEHGIYGEAARAKTLLYRKHGFNRVDLIETASVPVATLMAQRHPELFEARAVVKREWSPALSIISLDVVPAETTDGVENLAKAASRQTCEDFELLVRTAHDIWPTRLGGRLRRVPSALAGSRAEALRQGLEISRGRYALATYGSPAALLDDPTLIEKTLRALQVNPSLDAIGLAESEPGLTGFRLLRADAIKSARLGALCWPATGPSAPPASLELAGDQPLETLALWLAVYATVQWRHLPRRDQRAIAAARGGVAAAIGAPGHRRPRDARIRAQGSAAIPELPPGVAERVRGSDVWVPPQTHPLCRHLHHHSGRYVFSHGPGSPPGCSLHYHLGSLRGLPLTGTVSLVVRRDGGDSPFALGEDVALDAAGLLGFIEQSPLPLFDPLWIARHRETGQRVLIAGAEDPLAQAVEDRAFIGFIEPYPIHPRRAPHVDAPYGLVGLIRTVDDSTRRHRYGAGRVPQGQVAGELGALLAEPLGDCAPLWINVAGDVSAADQRLTSGRPSLRTAARWTGAPLTWRGFSTGRYKLRATARRAYESARILTSQPAIPSSRPTEPAGYLLRSASDRTVPLYAATHPVTGDRLLSTREAESRYLGYKDTVLLGHLVARAPVTGTIGLIRPGVPWAARFGLVVGE